MNNNIEEGTDINPTLTKEEIEALIKVVDSVNTTVKSAQSWIELKAKLERMIQILDDADKNTVDPV